MSIVNFIKGLGASVKNTDLRDDIAVTRQQLIEYGIPAYQSLQTSNLWQAGQKLLAAPNVKRQASWSKGFKANIKGTMFQQTYVLMTKVPAILDGITRTVQTSGELHPEGLDYRTAATLQLFAALKFYTGYTTKLLLLSTAQEAAVRANSHDLPYAKAEILQIEEQFADFIQISNFIAKHHTNWDAMLKAIPEVAVDITGENGLVGAYGEAKLDPMRQNLVATGGWNLIYTFRAWQANRQKARYDAMKVEKANLELRLLQLKQQLEGGQDPALEKTIAYQEKRLLDLNDRLRKEEELYV